MIKSLSIGVFALLISTGLDAQQQSFTEAPQTYTYSFQLENIGEWDDDGTVKRIQTALRPTFDALMKFNEVSNEFTITTSFPVEREKLEIIVLEEGFELIEFNARPNFIKANN